MLLAATAGFCAYLLPVALDPAARHYEAAFLSFVRGNAFNVAVPTWRVVRASHQLSDPGSPLNGPTTSGVTHPP